VGKKERKEKRGDSGWGGIFGERRRKKNRETQNGLNSTAFCAKDRFSLWARGTEREGGREKYERNHIL